MRSPATRRGRALALVQVQLARKNSPYFILLLVLAATGLAGFLSDRLMLMVQARVLHWRALSR